MAHPLDGPWHKVERAKFHLHCLDDAARDFVAKQPYRTHIELDLEHSKKVLWVEVDEPPLVELEDGRIRVLAMCSALSPSAWPT